MTSLFQLAPHGDGPTKKPPARGSLNQTCGPQPAEAVILREVAGSTLVMQWNQREAEAAAAAAIASLEWILRLRAG